MVESTNSQHRLRLEEVFPGFSSITIEGRTSYTITSNERMQKLVNQPQFVKENSIYAIEYNIIAQEMSVLIGKLYLVDDPGGHPGDKNLLHEGDESELLSDRHLVVAYSDGGLESLVDIDHHAGRTPSYVCRLFLPLGRTFLEYRHPVKNEQLLARFKR
jgi:hypothetical protein